MTSLAAGNLLIAVGTVFNLILNAVLILIIIRCVLSWVNPDPYNQVVQLIYRTTEPILRPMRRIIPPIGRGLDLTPILASILLVFLQQFIGQTLMDWGQAMRFAH